MWRWSPSAGSPPSCWLPHLPGQVSPLYLDGVADPTRCIFKPNVLLNPWRFTALHFRNLLTNDGIFNQKEMLGLQLNIEPCMMLLMTLLMTLKSEPILWRAMLPVCKSDPAGQELRPWQWRRPLRTCCSMKTGPKVVAYGLMIGLVKKWGLQN